MNKLRNLSRGKNVSDKIIVSYSIYIGYIKQQ